MLNILKHSHFSADPFGHGGSKRTAQINGLLTDAGIVFSEADFETGAITKNKALFYLRGLIHNRDITIPLKNNYATGRYLRIFEDFVDREQPDLFLLEATSEYYLLLAEVLVKNNVPVIGLPHNLESLASGSKNIFSHKRAPFWLFDELNYLRLCQKNFTISSEESWLLSCTGLAAEHLPYYPARQAEEFLLNIRERKRHTEKKENGRVSVLLLGTFYNKPTADGYIELIQAIKKYADLEIIVAGHGSEQLKAIFSAKNVRVLGAVSNDRLAELIISCDYAVIQQQPSSGALTRIPELLLAGIPVLANEHAARSSSGLKGIKVYRSYPQLLEQLYSPLPSVPVIERPVAENILADYIKNLV